jgi:SAM-dependent methyltransferase
MATQLTLNVPTQPTTTDPRTAVFSGRTPILRSGVCRFEHFQTDWYRAWAPLAEPDRPFGLPVVGVYRPELRPAGMPGPLYHRKSWEWCAAAQTLWERGKLAPGMRALGFAVGNEPMASIFASFGVEVEATDLDPNLGRSADWMTTNQHASSIEALYKPHIVDRPSFDSLIRFRYADMNGEWDFPEASYDFVWSCCSLEHLGSLMAGIVFVVRAARLLKPGGIAVHTTEYNVSSNGVTAETGPSVIYRRADIEEIDRVLRREGRCLATPDFDPGDHEFDRLYDVPPYYQIPGRQHVKLLIEGHVSTSFLLTVLN